MEKGRDACMRADDFELMERLIVPLAFLTVKRMAVIVMTMVVALLILDGDDDDVVIGCEVGGVAERSWFYYHYEYLDVTQ